jgi:hypothetical protein
VLLKRSSSGSLAKFAASGGLVAGQPVGCGERTVRANTSVRPAGCLGRCTRKYLSRKPPSRAGSAPPQLTHIRSAAADRASTPTTLYFAPQLGQLNGVGLRWAMSRLCQSSTPSDKPSSREIPCPNVLFICRREYSFSEASVFFGFAPFGLVFFSNSALVVLKVL